VQCEHPFDHISTLKEGCATRTKVPQEFDHIYPRLVEVAARRVEDVVAALLVEVVVAALLVEVVVAALLVEVELGLLVLVLLTLLYVLVGVSGTATVGSRPTVMSALPLPCCPSIPITM
jgi:hypothetical protein